MTENSANLEQVARVQRLFLEHIDTVRGFVLGLMPDFARVDDVVQETFLTVTRKAADFQPDTHFARWACAIARYKVLEARRAAPQEAVLSEEVLEALAADESAVARDPRLDHLRACMEQLAPAARRALALRYETAHKPAEIARVLGCGADTVYVALSKARTFLRECIERRSMMNEALQP